MSQATSLVTLVIIAIMMLVVWMNRTMRGSRCAAALIVFMKGATATASDSGAW